MRAIVRHTIIAFAFLAAAGRLGAEIVIYDSGGKRDPFFPSEEAEDVIQETAPPKEVIDTSEFEAWFSANLSGIMWDSETPYALLGDNMVGIGYEKRGCTIVEIGPDSITFQYKTKLVKVPLRQSLLEETGTDDD